MPSSASFPHGASGAGLSAVTIFFATLFGFGGCPGRRHGLKLSNWSTPRPQVRLLVIFLSPVTPQSWVEQGDGRRESEREASGLIVTSLLGDSCLFLSRTQASKNGWKNIITAVNLSAKQDMECELYQCDPFSLMARKRQAPLDCSDLRARAVRRLFSVPGICIDARVSSSSFRIIISPYGYQPTGNRFVTGESALDLKRS